MRVKIEIDTKTFVRFWLVVIAFVFAILCLYLAQTALIIIATAAFLAVILNQPVNKISNYIPGRSRVGATAAAYMLVVLFLTLIITLVVPPIIQQTGKFVGQLPQAVERMSNEWDGVGKFVEQYNLQPQIDQAVENAKGNMTKWAASLTANIMSSLGSLFAFIGAVFLVLVLSFLMLIEGPNWTRMIWGLYSDKETMREHRTLVGRMTRVVAGYANGQLAVSGVGALFSGLAVFILSLVFPAVDGNLAMPIIAFTFVLVLIPMFGSTIAGVLASLLIALSSLPAAIIFAVYFIVYQQIENNFISPAIQSKYIELSPLTVLAAATIGIYMWGLIGGIIAIPIAGCVKVFLEYRLGKSDRGSRKKSDSGSKLLGKLKSANAASKA
jgi:predicted PurR-regulated permease PerM